MTRVGIYNVIAWLFFVATLVLITVEFFYPDAILEDLSWVALCGFFLMQGIHKSEHIRERLGSALDAVYSLTRRYEHYEDLWLKTQAELDKLKHREKNTLDLRPESYATDHEWVTELKNDPRPFDDTKPVMITYRQAMTIITDLDQAREEAYELERVCRDPE